MLIAAAAFFFLQGLFITLDEWLCHRRRVLPKWELAGHPLDTFFLLVYFISLAGLAPENHASRIVVLTLAAVSCLVITKDEWVHSRLSTGFENWLHSLLFLVHPIVAGFYYLLWIKAEAGALPLFQTSAVLTFVFFVYQCFSGVRRWRET